MTRNPDPKHGRWILPLIIVAMVVLTFTFVNNLEPAEHEEGTTTTLPAPSTTTTTTLPPNVAAFLVTLDVLETQARGFIGEVQQINTEWEGRIITFGDARAAFVAVRQAISAWEADVADASDVPQHLAEGHVALVLAVEELAPAVEDIITGLEEADDGSLRRVAVAAFDEKAAAVLDAIAELRRQARSGGEDEETTTTVPGSSEEPTSSTSGTNA